MGNDTYSLASMFAKQQAVSQSGLGDYKCDVGMFVENVPANVNIKTQKGRFIAHKLSAGWTVCVCVCLIAIRKILDFISECGQF